MKLARRISLNNVQMDEISPAVVIRSIDTGATKRTVQTSTRLGGSGQRVTGRHWDALEVRVTYAIDIPKRNLEGRKAVFDAVNAWAMQKGWLRVNYMTGKRLYVSETTVQSGDLWQWTDEYEITFTAYGVPFWQSNSATVVTLSDGGGTITVPGILETVCNADLTNAGDSTINTLTIQAGNSTFGFTNLGLAAGQRLVIGHWAESGDLYIRKMTGDVIAGSAMGARTSASADDLYVSPGANTVTVTGGTITGTVDVCGRWNC